MLIRHKITLWFIGLSALLLFLFSVYIYIASAKSRKQLFYERLKNKALATREIYDLQNAVAEKVITSLPEQSQYVFDEHNILIFSINDLHDFKFDDLFFNSVIENKELYFEYSGGVKMGFKEGYAFVFKERSKRLIIVSTAYNKASFEQLASLRYDLLIGNLLFLVAVGIFSFFASIAAFKPIKRLVSQIESFQSNDLSFRLIYPNSNDEIGIVASSFNKALSRIQRLVESQKSFISYASHELRTPLTAISGILETSLTYDKDFESILKSGRAAKKETIKAISLVNGLLELAKIESMRSVEQIQPINIVDILMDTISDYKAKSPNQEFQFELEEVFSKHPIEVAGNFELLRTALFNLIDNASKYSERRKIKIVLSLNQIKQIIIYIIDSGIGIDPSDKDHLFDPLFRGKNTKGIDGFGLGLSLTYRIISIFEGEIHLSPNLPSGTVVEIKLPSNIG